MTDRTPPSTLAAAGKALWVATHADRLVTDTQAELLLLACKQADRAAESRLELTKAEIICEDRFGQEKIHPAVQIERMASLACAAIMEKILGKAAADKEEIDDDAELFG